MGNEYGKYLWLNERTDIGSFIRANTVLFLELEYGYNWNIHWEPNSDLLVNW